MLVASSAVTKDHILLAADVRLALRRSITHPFVRKQELTVYTLNNELENLLTNVVNQAQQGGKVMLDSVPVDPNMLNQFQSTMPQVKEQMKAAGKTVLLVPPQLRLCWRVMQGCLRQGCMCCRITKCRMSWS